jgi:hypothetical protein
MDDVPGRSPSGVRLAGDEYQHLVTWNEVLLAPRPGSDVVGITVEARDAGSVDDIVVERRSGPTIYTQVKHAVDARSPVGTAWLTARSGGVRSLLGRFHDSWRTLSASGGDLVMQLVTDREIDPSDALMSLLDRRTELLVPAIASASAGADVARIRAGWASHLEIDEDVLLDMLAHLRFQTGRPIKAELERADSLMWGHGLRTGRNAVDSAIAFVREWVQERWRTLSVDELSRLVEERIRRERDPGALLVIEAIDDDLHPEDATEHLRWVELYEGHDPNRRRQLRDHGDWQRTIGPELEAAAERLRSAGQRRVLVRGALRLPVWFAAGAALRHVGGFDVAALQHGSIWSSDTATGTPARPEVTVESEHRGDHLVLAIGVAADPAVAVRRFLDEEALPVGRIAFLRPVGGPGPEVVPDGPTAARMAVGWRDTVRDLLEEYPAEHIHLFLSAPGGLALLLGHRWNALRPTTVYEHLGAGSGYASTLTIQA